MIRRRVVVHGQVQGVGFRANARAEARRLGVSGYAANLHDNTVELEVEGSVESVERMLDWLRVGPRYATVHSIDVSELGPVGGNSVGGNSVGRNSAGGNDFEVR
jgi:acylphosphatase